MTEDYRETYTNFWAPILDAPGVDREDQIRRELHDYSFLMSEVPKVYDAVTGGVISKPNTMAGAVVGEFERRFVRGSTVARDLRQMVAGASDFDELRQLVAEYADDVDEKD